MADGILRPHNLLACLAHNLGKLLRVCALPATTGA